MQHSISQFLKKLDVIAVKANLLRDANSMGLEKDAPTVDYLISDIQALAREISNDIPRNKKNGND